MISLKFFADLESADTREDYNSSLRNGLDEIATALCTLAHDEHLQLPFRIEFADARGPLAQLTLHEDRSDWTVRDTWNIPLKMAKPPVTATLVSADRRTLTMGALE
jgi:hypothetical protein